MSPTPEARARAGAAIRAARKSRSLSVESAAKAGGIGHMTWRKVEQGGSVHDQSYFAVDRALGWQGGTTRAAVDSSDPAQYLTSANEASTKKQRTATREDVAPDENSSDAFYAVLSNVDALTLPELKAINAVVEVRIRERTDVLDSVKKKINSIDWTFPRFRVEYLASVPEHVGNEYQSSYGRYMAELHNMQQVASLTHECESQRAANTHELQQLWERAQEVGSNLDEIVQRYNAAEENLIKHHGTTTQQDTEQQ